MDLDLESETDTIFVDLRHTPRYLTIICGPRIDDRTLY